MTVTETIAAAIDRIDEKKAQLKKSFDDLQAHHSILSPSFSLSWSDIDSYFSSLQSSLSNRFYLVQSTPPLAEEETVVESELRTMCEKMDGIGLRKYLIDRWDDAAPLNLEVAAAMRYSPDPASMVLDAIENSNQKLGT